MNLNAIHPGNSVIAADSWLAGATPGATGAGDFASALQTASSQGREEPVREAATKLVSSALLLPVLAMLREQGPTDGPFAPGDAERRFGPLLDQEFADRITSSANFGLIDSIVKRYTRNTDATRVAPEIAASSVNLIEQNTP